MRITEPSEGRQDESDAALFVRYRNGDESAFDELYAKHRHDLAAFVHSRVPYDDADDVLQEVFRKVVRAKNTFHAHRNFKSWLFQIAANACIDYFRAVQRKRDVPFSTLDMEGSSMPPSPQSSQHDLVSGNCLDEALSGLPPLEEAALRLHYLQRQTYRQVAASLHTSNARVARLLQEGRHHLRERLSA